MTKYLKKGLKNQLFLKKYKQIGFLIVLFFVLMSWFILKNINFKKTDSEKALSFVKINNLKIEVEIADNQQKRAVGLSGKKTLSQNQGMLFLFNKKARYSFWMKNMFFPIDIIWIDQNKKIIDISKNISPQSYPKTFSPQKPVQYVLEINAGFAEKNNIKIGDKVDF